MRILEHRAIPGPNHHSPYPTILMRLDTAPYAGRPSTAIPGFAERLMAALPSLAEHRCSVGTPGGFTQRLAEGTLLGHVVEHVAIELQCLAGIRVGFGKTRGTSDPAVFTVVYRYREAESGLEAGRLAVPLVEALAEGQPVDVAALVTQVRAAKAGGVLGPSTEAIVQEARRRGIPVTRLNDASFVQLGHGARAQRIQASMTGGTSCLGAEIADDKDRTKAILGQAGIPVPVGEVVATMAGALEAAAEIGYPVVVKPLVGNHGRGVTTNIRTPAEMEAAVLAAQRIHPRVLVERMLLGDDFRVLVVNQRFVAAARREPGSVRGDGQSTVAQLVEQANADPARGDAHEKWLTRIAVDDEMLRTLASQQMTLESRPGPGQVVRLKGTANLSTGGTATDVTGEVHPAVKRMCERAGRLIGLDVVGLDIVAPHLRAPLTPPAGIVEVNAAPGLRMHAHPTQGRPVNVGAPILDMLFPGGSDGRIPIVAVTGTNGKTTTVRLIAHVLGRIGAEVGVATTSGVEIDGEQVLSGDYSGPEGARAVLGDPLVDHAVLEVARGGILRRGLGYDRAHVGVLLNVANDHLGEGGIEDLEDLAEVKAVVVENVARAGTAVLNAEDPHVAAYSERLRSKVTLFALDSHHPLLAEHIARSGTVVTVEGHLVVVRDGGGDDIVGDVRDFPVTMKGAAAFNIQNLLAAVASCRALGIACEAIGDALLEFQPDPATLPGRMNIIPMPDYTVLVDYGHNVPALNALAPVVKALARTRAIAMANASGNRRDADIRAFGEALARMYDFIVLCDPDPRGREPGVTMDLVKQGILAGGLDPSAVETAASEMAAIDRTLDLARPGDLVVLQVDDVRGALAAVDRRRRAAVPGDAGVHEEVHARVHDGVHEGLPEGVHAGVHAGVQRPDRPARGANATTSSPTRL